jgi:hypothetical protein
MDTVDAHRRRAAVADRRLKSFCMMCERETAKLPTGTCEMVSLFKFN